MNQEIEIEFKNLVDEQEFMRLCDAFFIQPSDFNKQVNYYFETPSFGIKAAGAALRIRFKNNKYVLTLKEPYEDDLLETHQPLSSGTAEALINGKVTLPDGNVKEQLLKLHIPVNALLCLGSLTTFRAIASYQDGEMMLDRSLYFGVEDFECEYEAKNRLAGEKAFSNLLNQHKIKVRKTPNKIQRFFDRKMMEESSYE